MVSTIIASVLGAVATIIAAFAGVRFRRKKAYDDLEDAVESVIDFLRSRLRAKATPPRARTVVHTLRSHHSLNLIIAAMYLLRERDIINWEDANILKPEHKVELQIR